MDTHAFERQLRMENYAANTIVAYRYAVREYYALYRSLNKDNLIRFKDTLMERYRPRSVNLRIRGFNKYLEFIGRNDLKIKAIKLSKSSFLEHVISNEDYAFFKHRLRREKDRRWYFVVWTLAATGARISELVQLKAEHVRTGYYDIYSKGGKMRRIYLPARLWVELLSWMDRDSGYLFVNFRGERITPRGIALRLKEFAVKYGIDPAVVHPHSFRHLYAKNFLARNNDLVLLADLLGHDSVDTTRIYLQRSTLEQRRLVDRVVDW